MSTKKYQRKRRQQNPLVPIGIGIFLIVIAVLFMAAPKSDSKADSLSSVVPMAVNFAAPELSLENIQGETRSLTDYRNDVVLVNNWPTWCPPCKAEMPTLSGAALAFGAYNGTMLLATASTGTAISTLSGAAATNATLAWLGGGTIAAGGGGVALGTMILGGVVAGPALAIFGHIVGNKGEEALNNARSNYERARTICDEGELMAAKLNAIEKISTLANGIFSAVSTHLRHAVYDLKQTIEAEGENYQALSSEGRENAFRSVKFAQLIKAMIDTPISASHPRRPRPQCALQTAPANQHPS